MNRNFSIRRLDTSVLVAKSEPFSCEVLSTLLAREGFDVVGRTTEMNDFFQKVRVKKPNCIITEAAFVNNKTDEFFKELAEKKSKLVVYINDCRPKELAALMSKSFHGYLHTNDSLDELYKCLTMINGQVKYYSPSVKRLLNECGIKEMDSQTATLMTQLTKREHEILYWITEGLTGYEIADLLFISYRTLANHKQNIIQKLGIDSNRHLLKFGLSVKPYLFQT
jgi:DNA-binding NarL/FixJ family response regulator